METQVTDMSPIAKNLERSFALVDEKSKQDKTASHPDSKKSPGMEKGDSRLVAESTQTSKAAMEHDEPINAIHEIKEDGDQCTKDADVTKKEGLAAPITEVDDDALEDPFHSKSDLSREQQMCARDDMKAGADGNDEDAESKSAAEDDEKKTIMKRPAAKAKGKAKAKAKAKGKPGKKSSAKAEAKPKKKPSKKGKSKGHEDDEEGTSLEPSVKRRGRPPKQPEASPAKPGDPCKVQKGKDMAEGKPARKKRDTQEDSDKDEKVGKNKKGRKTVEGKATFARRYQPMLDAWASKKWCAIKNAFELHIQQKVIRPSGLEELLTS